MTFNIKNILVPLDFSKTSLNALNHATQIAKVKNAKLVLLNALEYIIPLEDRRAFSTSLSTAELSNTLEKNSNEQLEKLATKLKNKGIKSVVTLTVYGGLSQRISETVIDEKIDLVVMGTHGVSGFREFFIGSNTFKVIRDIKCPVLSVNKDAKAEPYKNILLPYRDKRHSRENVDEAIGMAQMFGGKLNILAVDTEFRKSHKKKLDLQVKQIIKFAERSGVKATGNVIEHVYVGETILKYAKRKKIDLLVIMSDLDRMDITEYFTGPFAQQVVNHSPIPVLSVRPRVNPDKIDLTFY